MKLPMYMKLDEDFASIVPTTDGGAAITKSTSLYSIADFMESGTVIGKDEYDSGMEKLGTDKAVSP